MNSKKVGSFIKELRKEKGVTQEQFAAGTVYFVIEKKLNLDYSCWAEIS